MKKVTDYRNKTSLINFLCHEFYDWSTQSGQNWCVLTPHLFSLLALVLCVFTDLINRVAESSYIILRVFLILLALLYHLLEISATELKYEILGSLPLIVL